MEQGQEQVDDVLFLINSMLPDLARCLAKQRRDYGLDEELFPVEFPIMDPAENVDQTPVNNMDMERLMGKTDYRLQKVKKLGAASRGIILGSTHHLRERDQGNTFRSYKKEVEAKREKETEWNSQQRQKFDKEADMIQEVALTKERKRIALLEKLKEDGGPFTSAEQVEEYLASSIPVKVKQARLKKEMQFARDSSTTLPRVDPLFNIQVTMNNRKRRDKTAEEFAESLMVYLGRKADRMVMEYQTFKDSLRTMGN